MALHKKDISFTLYEEAPEFSAVGLVTLISFFAPLSVATSERFCNTDYIAERVSDLRPTACERSMPSNRDFGPCMRRSASETSGAMHSMCSSRACCWRKASVRLMSCHRLYRQWQWALTMIVTGEGEPWFGKSSWGHPDFDRKSVRVVVVHACIVIARC